MYINIKEMSSLSTSLVDLLLIIISVLVATNTLNVFQDMKRMALFLGVMYVLTIIILFYKCYRTKKCNDKDKQCQRFNINWNKTWIPWFMWVVWIGVVFVLRMVQEKVPNPIVRFKLGLATGSLGIIVFTLAFYYTSMSSIQSDCVPNYWEIYKQFLNWLCTTSIGKFTPFCLVKAGIGAVGGLF